MIGAVFASAFSVLALASGVCVTPGLFPYLGNAHQEAVMTFDATVQFNFPAKFGQATEELVREEIRRQTRAMLGPMQFTSSIKAAAGRAPLIGIKSISHISEANGIAIWEAKYSYQGGVLVGQGASSFYRLHMPANPDTFHKVTLEHSNGSPGINFCTDPTYQNTDDLWYFWSPERQGCTLVAGRDYLTVEAAITPKIPPPNTLPEYERLVRSDKTIHIYAAFGMAAYTPNPGPNEVGYIGYRGFIQKSVEDGFVVDEAAPDHGSETSLLSKQSSEAKVLLHVFYGATGVREPTAQHFHKFMREAFERRSVFLYNGHSGLGGNLDFDLIKRSTGVEIRPNPDEYQILLLNGCSSYSHYPHRFFAGKATPKDPAGSKNLDIITNGLEGFFNNGYSYNVSKAIDDWASRKSTTGYRQIISTMNPNSFPGVSGEEDNPPEPRK